MIQNFDELQGHDPEAEEAIASLDDAPPVKDEPKVEEPTPPPAIEPPPAAEPAPVDPGPAVQ